MSNEDVFAMAANENSEAPEVTNDKLGAISKLASKQKTLADEVAALETRLKTVKSDLQRVEEHDLPEAMDAVGMEEFKLTDGTKIKISTFYNASISPDRKDEAFEWLDERGHGGLIKTEVSLEFGRGELDVAREFMVWLKSEKPDLSPEFAQSVHWQTLRAFVREQIESPTEDATLPLDLFGVFIGRKAKLTPPKK